MEARTAQAFRAVAERLNSVDTTYEYRVITSLRVPASLLGKARHAKAEWDTVVLVRPRGKDASRWRLRLLVEAKSSIEAAITDFPGLLRGLQLLAKASAGTDYCFQCAQGNIQIRGASLAAFATMAPDRHVVYCCDAAPDAVNLPLSTTSRMQLLTLPGSLAYATALMKGEPAPRATETLAAAWNELITAPRYRPLVNQRLLQRRARERIIHTDDLLSVVEACVVTTR